MIRIRGAVKIAKQVKSALQEGIPITEADKFRQYITRSVADIENICRQKSTSPDSLPVPSRNAYQFLKNLDLDNLPLREISPLPKHRRSPASALASTPVIRLKNILKQQKHIQQQITEIASEPTLAKSKIALLRRKLELNTQDIETICAQKNQSLNALTDTSIRVYAWMKFLTLSGNLVQHLLKIQEIQQIAQKYWASELKQLARWRIELTNFEVLFRSRHHHGQFTIQLNEGFLVAEKLVLSAILESVFSQKNSKNRQIVHQFAESEAYSDIMLELDLLVDMTTDNAQGKYYDLNQLYSEICRDYFQGQLIKPRLSWNKRLTKRKYGHYEPAKDRVVISQTLDNISVPPYVIAFVLYHELLHKRHGSQWYAGKRQVHTPAFRRDEKRFKEYDLAQYWLTQLARD